MGKVIALAFGSLAGGFARYYLAGLIHRLFGSGFPYGTLAVNLSGCFLVGVLAAVAEGKLVLGPESRFLLMTGFCGAFTTFSTFMLETGHLVRDGQVVTAFLNILMSIVMGFILYRMGDVLGKMI